MTNRRDRPASTSSFPVKVNSNLSELKAWSSLTWTIVTRRWGSLALARRKDLRVQHFSTGDPALFAVSSWCDRLFDENRPNWSGNGKHCKSYFPLFPIQFTDLNFSFLLIVLHICWRLWSKTLFPSSEGQWLFNKFRGFSSARNASRSMTGQKYLCKGVRHLVEDTRLFRVFVAGML